MGEWHPNTGYTQTPWFWEESEDSWQLFGGPGPMPLQLAKCPKYGTPYAEYWPNEADSDFLIRAVNSHEALLEAARSVIDAWEAGSVPLVHRLRNAVENAESARD